VQRRGQAVLDHLLGLQIGEGRVQLLELFEVVEGGLDTSSGVFAEVTMVASTP
jgi:hypothetical protein